MIARRLTELWAGHVLILAAMDGLITDLRCAMPECRCPQGREYFEQRTNPMRGPWAPSADRYPIPGRDGGEYTPENVRLAHWRCNNAEGRRVANERQVERGFYQSDHWRAISKRGNQATSPATRSCGGHTTAGIVNARRQRNGVYQSAEWRAIAVAGGQVGGRAGSHEQRVKAGTVGMCTRWNIQRGKPCICGHHATA